MSNSGYCMERGLDNDPGYDCSGLVIASVCDVLGVATSAWPPNLRHAKQLLALSQTAEDPRIGDALLYVSYKQPDAKLVTHIGVFAEAGVVVHASGVTGMVEESAPRFNSSSIVTRYIVRAAALAELLS
jgi:hypothetical protein